MLSLKRLSVKLQDFTLRNIELNINAGEYFMLVGPTGAGKTLLLETIAGLYRVQEGEIWLSGENITELEPERRGIGLVYQDCALFPHLSVAENIAFGLIIRKVNRQLINQSLKEIVATIEIAHLLNRRPDTLSGGERQKVALARSLILKPRLLLLDEPLSALDPETRENLREELRILHRDLNITTIHVTHDFEEAVSLGDRMAVVGNGEIKQVGTPEQIFRKPISEFVARFAMVRNVFTGEIRNFNDKAIFTTSGTDFIVDNPDIHGRCFAAIRPEDITISQESLITNVGNCLAGTITQIVNRGATLTITVDVPPVFFCLVTRHYFEELNLSLGQKVYIYFKTSVVHIFKK